MQRDKKEMSKKSFVFCQGLFWNLKVEPRKSNKIPRMG